MNQIIKKLTTFSCLLIVTFNLSSQTISRDVISNGGDEFENVAVGTLSWTIGEVVTETIGNSDAILTQGYQQGKLMVSNIQEELSVSINLFPNPTHNFLIVESEDSENLLVRLTTLNGKIVLSKDLKNQQTQIDVSQLVPATYIVQILDSDTNQRNSYKIIKQ